MTSTFQDSATSRMTHSIGLSSRVQSTSFAVLLPLYSFGQLRIRAEQLDRLPAGNLQAIQEDEALLVKGIHGKRQHPITDNCTELRVSFTPIQLVKIDLSKEEPDEEADFPRPARRWAEMLILMTICH